MKAKLLLLVSSIIAGPFCGASLAQDRPNYAELTVGWSSFSLDKGQFDRNALTVSSVSDSSTGYTLRIGRQMSPLWSVEGAYVDAGYMNVRGYTAIGDAWSAHYHLTNWTLGGTIRHSLVDEKLEIFARLGGVAFVNEIGKSPVAQRILYDQERGTGLYFGVGMNFRINERFALTGSVDRYAVEQETTAFSGGVKFAF